MDNQFAPQSPQEQAQQPIINQSQATQTSPRRSAKLPLLILLLVLLFAGASYGIYAWQHKKVNDADKKTANLQSQLSSLQSQVNKLSQQTKSSNTGTAASTSSSLKISQLGIKLPLDSSISDLSYTWNSTNSSAELGSTTLMKENEQENPSSCSPTNTASNPAYPIAVIINSKNVGSGSFGAPNSPGGPVKTTTINGQTYYWYLPGAGNGCTDPTATFTNQLNTYYNSALASFSSAAAI